MLQLFASQPWLNTEQYSLPLLMLFAVGCFGWVIAYVEVSRQYRRTGYVEIPWFAVAANISWEVVWGWWYGSDMGKVLTLGYALWALQDVYITYNLFKVGHKQLVNKNIGPWFKRLVWFSIAAWAVMIYLFVADGYDTGYGAISGYILNVMMSALYIVLIIRSDVANFSAIVAWSKMWGPALLSVFNAIIRPTDHFLMALCAVTLLLDIAYLVIFYARRRAAAARPSGAAA